MDILRFSWCLVFAYILSGIQSVSGCITTEFLNGNSVLKLSCPIASFTGSATWNLDGIQKTSCLANGFCSTVASGVYGFTSDSSGIYARIDPFSLAEVGKVWICNHSPTTCNTTIENAPSDSLTSQMSTYLATERTTSVNSIFEFSNITIPMITGSITSTSDILALNKSYLNTGSTNFNAHTESPNFYSNTEATHFYTKTESITSYANAETTNLYANIETTIFYANTETINVDVNTEINEIQTKSLTQSLLLSIPGNNSCIQQIITNTESPLMSSTVIDQISYSLKMEDPYFSSHQYLSETTVTLPNISVSSQLPSSIIDTMNHFKYTTNTLITSYLDKTRHSFDDLTDGFQTFSQNYAGSAKTSMAIVFQSTNHHLSLQSTEYYEIMQTEFTSYVTTPLYESRTDNAATGIYSKEKVTSGKSYMHTSVMPSQTQLASMNDIQDSKTDFKSTYLETYSQSNDVVSSSEISEYLLSTLQSTSLLLSFNAKANASGVDSYMKTNNMSTFGSQSGIQIMDLSAFTNPSSIQISTVLLDFKTTLLTTTINFNSKTMPSMIKPSSKQTSNGQDMTSLSSGDYKSISTLSTNIIQSGLNEKNKTIIFITTTSAVITMIVVILLFIFAKVYMSKDNKKPRKEHDNLSWSNKSIPPKAAFPDHSFTGKSIYPLLNTSSVSFKMFHYEQHWNDIV